MEISRDSLGDAIYRRLCQELVRGKLRPNQRVTIRGLADTLGTGSTPVRDVRVPMLTTDQYTELSRIRAELEGLAAEMAARVATDKDVAHLRRLVTRDEEAIATARWPLTNELNQQFHFTLAEIADMPVLLDVLGRLWLRMGPLLSGYCATAKEDMMLKHHAIVAACESHDSSAAHTAMRADIETAREGIVNCITSLEST